ncbi:hypothetical protein HK405_006653 [Cladochytrium tenue]|nr:hypothetical protein HK405_006653 [Cladochytrium tenue]
MASPPPPRPPFRSVHAVDWEDTPAAAADAAPRTSTSSTTTSSRSAAEEAFFVVHVVTAEPVSIPPSDEGYLAVEPTTTMFFIRRPYEDFVAMGGDIDSHIAATAQGKDALFIQKKRKQSISFLTLPKPRSFVTRAVNEERVSFLDMYLQDLMTLSQAVWTLPAVTNFFVPTPSDWSTTRLRIQPKVNSKSAFGRSPNPRPAWFLSIGRRAPAVDRKQTNTRAPSPLNGLSNGTWQSLPRKSTNRRSRSRSRGRKTPDDASLDEGWLAPVEERRRVSRMIAQSEMDAFAKAIRDRMSILPKVAKDGATVSASAMSEMLSSIYDEAARAHPPRNSVVARKFVVASAAADAEINRRLSEFMGGSLSDETMRFRKIKNSAIE